MKYEDEEWLRSAYENHSIQEMADMIDCSTATIHKYMNKYGVERPSKHHAKGGQHTDAEWLREKYHTEELSESEIAELSDVGKSTIHYWLERHNIERRSKSDSAKLRMEKNPELARKLIKSGTKALEKHGSNPKEEMTEREFEEFKTRLSNDRMGEDNPMAGRTGPDHPRWEPDKAPHRFYSSKKWEETRQEVLERDNHKCRVCGMTNEEHNERNGKDLHVHHIHPISAGGGRFDTENLITLCNTDHKEWEGLYIAPQPIEEQE